MKQPSKKFWFFFITVAVLFLAGWFVFWEVRTNGLGSLKKFLGFLPIEQEIKTDVDTVISLADSLLNTEGKEKVFLLLFQNNLELRPGGGFIGSFGILKVRDGAITHFAVHDTGNFDGRIPDTVAPPYPMKETLKIPSLKLRDSNYSPDYRENAKWAEDFYHMGQGEEQFDGVVAITTNVLTSFLRITGPVTLDGYPGTYGADNAILDLEYQVEQGYVKQNIAFGERKSVMGILGLEILEQVKALSFTKKYELFKVVLDDLHRKDVQLLFKDEVLHADVVAAGWDGRLDEFWKDDYLMLVDANLNSWKSDYFVKRSYAYTIDISKEIPEAVLAITYKHTAVKKDWFTKDYQTFLRVYVPKGSFLQGAENTATKPVFGDFMNKKYFGMLVHVPLGTEKTVTLRYTLPKELEREWYDLKIEKQPGLNDVPVSVTVIKADGSKEEKTLTLNRNTILSTVE